MNRQTVRGRANPRRWLAVTLAALGLFLGGCPDEGVVCSEGLTRCGLDCVDLTAESDNCGSCGVACGQSQVCVSSVCQCREGSTQCGGQCVVTTSDPLNCGGCAGAGGTVCASGQVCEAGACKVACSPGLTRCGDSCVDLQRDPGNCGACAAVCTDSRSCRAGACTYDVVASCTNTGQVVGIQSGADIKGPNVPVGASPQTTARMQDVLLVLDGTTPALRQATLASYAELPETDPVGKAPNQLLVSDPFVYVLNSVDNTLGTFQRTATPGAVTNGTRFPAGLGLEPVTGGAINFGANTNPFAMARVGNELFVTLYGGFADMSAGGKVARVSLVDPARPTKVEPYLQLPSGATLQPFPGQSTMPTPAGITAFNGSLYIALNNLNASFQPGGPGLLAKVDPRNLQLESIINLGPECLNPGWVAPVGNQLVVSCTGRVTYDANFNVTAAEGTGLALLSAEDAVVARYALSCPPSATGCVPPGASRFAVVGSRVYLGEISAGRIFVIEVANNQLIERLGPTNAIAACPSSVGASLVGDVVAIE